ncbi:MAG: D-alanine-D-alanine ligase [Microgenomates group bacterium Gr01-1014_16]|nr:MAG: D-alanine-D-alanine ligase [Microgenomates group bacterium Gr01-1014_16]
MAVITALQVMQNLDQDKYEVIPIYISKSGGWVIGNNKFLTPESYKDLDKLISGTKQLSLLPPKPLPKIDVAFPVFHGPFGEDGTIQGFLEMLNIPYVGSGVLGSSLGMDKVLQKQVFSSHNLPQVKHLWFYRDNLPKSVSLKYPLYVKPANGGSSIGTTKVHSSKELNDALEIAACYDRKIIVEESAEGFNEINISVLGNSGSKLRTSVCEQPVPSKEVLTFSDKYESGSSKSAGMASAKRLIPAPIKPATAAKISDLAKTAFESLDCSGLARVDFLVSPDEKTIYINEINTIPGSLAFYLWQASNIPFPKLLDELIQLALTSHEDKNKTTYTFANNLLANLGETLKGNKLKG